MALIYETKHYLVQSADYPLVDRNDGGHITIDPKFKVSTRQELTPKQAIELMRLTIVVGAAMDKVMNQQGVNVGRINYQDNGNWSVFKSEGPLLHYHLYGRAKSAVHQPYGQTLYMPHKEENPAFYEQFQALTAEDVAAMQEEIISLFRQERFTDDAWSLG